MSHNLWMSHATQHSADGTERLKGYRFAKGNVSTVRRCDWCGTPALKGYAWCLRHQPGHARQRRHRMPGTRPHIAVIAREALCERTLPGELLAWPPVARIVAHTPRHTRPVLLVDLVRCLVWQALGDHEPWSLIVSRMRVAGLYLPGDPDLVEYVLRGR
jgi:hypothetical protein